MALIIGKLESANLTTQDKLKVYAVLEQVDKKLHDDIIDLILSPKSGYEEGFSDGEEEGREQGLADAISAIESL